MDDELSGQKKPKKLKLSEDDLQKHKKELMKPAYTEFLHEALQELVPEDAKRIVEDMTDVEIYSKVNLRQFQEDYIADYIDYLWEISEPAYWRHVKISLNKHTGLLWSDNMRHFKRMCESGIPDDVFEAVLDFMVTLDKDGTQDSDTIGCVIRAQVEKFGRMTDIEKRIAKLNIGEQAQIRERVRKMVSQECPYQFY